jgi:hypothetical protein
MFINSFMGIENIICKRRQIRYFDLANYPKKNLVDELIKKSYTHTPSRQNLIPYKVHILGPEQKEYKKILYNLSTIPPKGTARTFNNTNALAPYVLLLTHRLVTNPNPMVKDRMNKGYSYKNCNIEQYKSTMYDACIEIGIFSYNLTVLCLEQNIDVSYMGCFPKWNRKEPESITLWKDLPFVDDDPLLSLQLGYRCKNSKHNKIKGEWKPTINEIINWV